VLGVTEGIKPVSVVQDTIYSSLRVQELLCEKQGAQRKSPSIRNRGAPGGGGHLGWGHRIPVGGQGENLRGCVRGFEIVCRPFSKDHPTGNEEWKPEMTFLSSQRGWEKRGGKRRKPSDENIKAGDFTEEVRGSQELNAPLPLVGGWFCVFRFAVTWGYGPCAAERARAVQWRIFAKLNRCGTLPAPPGIMATFPD